MPSAPVVAAKTAVVLIVCLIVADVIGVIVCTLFDIAPIRAKSAVLPYAIWLVLGIFCGLSAYQGAGAWALAAKEGEWTDHAEAFRAGNLIVVTSAAILAALPFLFRRLYWTAVVAGEYYMPDSAPHSTLFALSVLGAMTGAHFLLLPTAPSR